MSEFRVSKTSEVNRCLNALYLVLLEPIARDVNRIVRAALADAYARGRDEADCEKASILDCVNTELRANHAGVQAVMTDDPCTVIRHLVDAAKRQGEARLRAQVQALLVADDGLGEVGDGKLVRRDDVLAAIGKG